MIFFILYISHRSCTFRAQNTINMVEALTENPILLLFIVAGLGYGVGSISIKGNSLGVAAVLFVGLFIGSFSPDLRIPEIITFLGLSIFVYTVGLGSGPSFFSTFKRRGWQDLIFVFVMLSFSASVAVGLHYLLGFEGSITAGLFVGSTTNTPALAGLLDLIRNMGLDENISKLDAENSVIGYSLSYPMGILGPMLAVILMQKLLKIDFPKEEREVLEREGLLSRLILPIRVERQLWGYLGFDDGNNSHRRWSEGEISILMVIGESIGGALQRQKMEETIRYEALHDRLTGLPNRTFLGEKLNLALQNAHRRGSLFALMFLDLDHFKIVNDTLGHAIGDRLLQAVVKRLSSCLREGDTIARWGGDEFIILLPNISRAKDAAAIAQRILEVLQGEFDLEGNKS